MRVDPHHENEPCPKCFAEFQQSGLAIFVQHLQLTKFFKGSRYSWIVLSHDWLTKITESQITKSRSQITNFVIFVISHQSRQPWSKLTKMAIGSSFFLKITKITIFWDHKITNHKLWITFFCDLCDRQFVILGEDEIGINSRFVAANPTPSKRPLIVTRHHGAFTANTSADEGWSNQRPS